MLGTSGNLSATFEAEDGCPAVVITASSRDKGSLSLDDFVELRAGAVSAAPPGRRPSAETSVHQAIYDKVPAARAALHVHTVASTLAHPGTDLPGTLDLTGMEMVKGWGLWEPGEAAELPVFANHADVPTIADEIRAYLSIPRTVPALLIAGHGLTAWGDSIAAAHRHVEITEFLCRVILARGVRRP